MAENKGREAVQYERMSLRHEHVENHKLPKIVIYYQYDSEEGARQIAYGIEEEGLPRKILLSDDPFKEALDNTLQKGLGVAVGVADDTARIFCRQFRKRKAFMYYEGTRNGLLRIVGKNSARILKHKPFIMDDDES